MISEEKFKQLKREVEDAKSEAQRAEGALTQQLTQLEEDYGCGSLKEAKALLTKYENAVEDAERRYERVVKEYENAWKQDG